MRRSQINRIGIQVVSAICVVTGLATLARAEVPRLVHYQGKLLTSSGAAASGPVTLTVTLYGDPSAATPLLFGPEVHAGVTLTRGLFSIQIGANTGPGVSDGALNASTVWLGVSVDGGPELTPRTRLVMAPYAAKTRSSEQLVRPDTFDPAVVVASDGNVGVGTASPGARKLMVAGDTESTAFYGIGAVPSGYSILGDTATPPEGFTYTGVTLGTPSGGGDSWTTKTPLSGERLTMAYAVAGGKIYIIGGGNGGGYVSAVDEYDPVANSWSSKAPISVARGWFGAATASNGKIYAVGGHTTGTTTTGLTEEYTPGTNTWVTKASLSITRHDHAVAASGSRIYVIGGSFYGPSYTLTATVEEYDPVGNSWTFKQPLLAARNGLFAATMPDGKVYVMGGHDPSVPLATVEAYDPTNDTWTPRASMLTPRYDGAAAVIDGKLYAVGGYNVPGAYLNTIEEYDSTANTWTARTSMTTGRYNLAAGAVSGKLYAIGGRNGGSLFSIVEEYTPPGAPTGVFYVHRRN